MPCYPIPPLYHHFLRIFWALFRRRIFFLRHFHLCFPGFFQARELLFIATPQYSTMTKTISMELPHRMAGPSGFSALSDFRTRGVWLRRPALYPG